MARVFQFTYQEREGATEIRDKKFIQEVEDFVNNNEEIIKSAKKSNVDFANSIRNIMEDRENDLYLFTMIMAKIMKSPRYSLVKNVEFQGNKYTVEVDSLSRTFCFLEN